jgi:ketosteroid isomerase-like protein
MRYQLEKWGAVIGSAAVVISVGAAACGRSVPADNKAVAEEVSAAWTRAFDAGDPAGLATLYAEDAHSFPPGSPAISGRGAIEAYWRDDIGSGGVTTKLTPDHSVAQGDLLHVAGTYDVVGTDGVSLAKGQYDQLWTRLDNAWKVEHEIWRSDPSMQRNPGTAPALSAGWVKAYNAGDAGTLMALYADDAELAVDTTGSIVGRDAIGSFWKDDFGTSKPSTALNLTDVYVAGDLAHLGGEYEVTEQGKVTKGRFVQLWMRDGNAWRIHREMWLRR